MEQRAERNKAREEAQQLRIKLDSVVKEMNMLKKINQDLVSEKENVENVATWKTEFKALLPSTAPPCWLCCQCLAVEAPSLPPPSHPVSTGHASDLLQAHCTSLESGVTC